MPFPSCTSIQCHRVGRIMPSIIGTDYLISPIINTTSCLRINTLCVLINPVEPDWGYKFHINWEPNDTCNHIQDTFDSTKKKKPFRCPLHHAKSGFHHCFYCWSPVVHRLLRRNTFCDPGQAFQLNERNKWIWVCNCSIVYIKYALPKF